MCVSIRDKSRLSARSTKPTSFVPEDAGVHMVYVEIDTNDIEPPTTIDADNGVKKVSSGHCTIQPTTYSLQDHPISNVKYTKWSKCSAPDAASPATRHRYQQCAKTDVRKCPKQTIPCKQRVFWHRASSDLKQHVAVRPLRERRPTFEAHKCEAVVVNGRKHCPHGVRIDTEGVRHYCRPDDC